MLNEMHSQQNDKYTEMHDQQNYKYTEMHGQQNDKYTEMHGQQNDKYNEMHGQQNVKITLCNFIRMHGAKIKFWYNILLSIYLFQVPFYRKTGAAVIQGC